MSSVERCAAAGPSDRPFDYGPRTTAALRSGCLKHLDAARWPKGHDNFAQDAYN